MLQNLFYLPPEIASIEGLYTGFHLYFWCAGVIVQFILATMLLFNSRKSREITSLHALILAYAYFFIAIAINRIFFILSYDPAGTITDHYVMLGIGYVFASSALVPTIFVIEKYLVSKTKFSFSILSILLLLLCIIPAIMPETLLGIRDTLQLLGFGTGLIWFGLYLWIAKSTTGSPRVKALSIIGAVVIALLGFFFDSERILELDVIPIFIAPLLYFLGSILLGFILLRND